MQRSGHVPFVSTWDGRADRLSYESVINAGMQWYLDDREPLGDPRLMRRVPEPRRAAVSAGAPSWRRHGQGPTSSRSTAVML